jgi:putative ATP-binding cassette transporter
MVYAAIIYSIVMSTSMVLFGRALIDRIEQRNRNEAQLRFEMGRVRENAESIAMIGGAEDEMKGIGVTMQQVTQAWTLVVGRQAWLTWLMGGNGVVAPVLPLLLAAPNYLSGEITLGALTQSAAAFVQVQVALNWLVDNYARIAEWLASVGRVVGLWGALADLDTSVGTSESERITIEDSSDGRIHLDALSVAQHNGRVMIDEADTVIAEGEKVLLMGESGTGKSTLIRAIAGLWPWGSGRVLLPAEAKVAFLPQRPYMPLGTLRQVLCYPDDGETYSDQALHQALARCGLRRLASQLDAEEQWDKKLSGGEQQGIAFARLLVQRPDIVIMDEATSALDTDSQDSMMELFRSELAGVTLISVAHRSELEDYHDRKLMLHRKSTGVEMAAVEQTGRRERLSRLLRRSLRPRPSPDPSSPVSH